MTKFILRRLILGAFIIFFGSLVAYAVIRSLPTSFVERMARQLSALPGAKSYTELIGQLNKMYGLDSSVLEGFFKWFGFALRGDFGYSWKFSQPVVEKFNSVIWYSVVINVFTFLLQAVICIPLGILAARKQYSATDYTVTVVALMGISLPTFFLATILKYIFSIKLGWFDLYGIVGRMHEQMTSWQQVLDIGQHMVLPVVTLMILSIGGLMRYTRTNMLEVLNADYIRTARAKGLSERVVINKHAFRNTMIPLISYMSYLLPAMFGGSMITETLFQIPGIGYISYQAITQGDIPFTMFYIVFIEVLTQFSLIIADISYAVADPRVRAN
ncbi:MAG TPA: ABC transporter permease [Clostridia bacterium]|jgi:peptide/nickel transport system permease protein|nr:ABC transporter permease [Clostridia bacterium]